MDGESGSIDRFVTDDDLAVLVHENQVRDTDLRKVHGKRVEPWLELGTFIRDFAGVDTHKSGQSESGRELKYDRQHLRRNLNKCSL